MIAKTFDDAFEEVKKRVERSGQVDPSASLASADTPLLFVDNYNLNRKTGGQRYVPEGGYF